MKILLVNQAFYPDVVSTAQYAADLAAQLSSEGHEVSVLTSRRAYDDPARRFPPEEVWRGVRIRRICASGLGKSARWRRMIDFLTFMLACALRLLCTRRHDAVIALTSPPLIAFLAACFVRLKGGKFLYWVMDLNPDQALAAGILRPTDTVAKLLEWMFRYTLRIADRVVVLDRFMLQRIRGRGIDTDKVITIAPWSHDGAVQYTAEGRDRFRERHHLTGKFVVMYSGNHSACHPLDTVIAAAERLADDPGIVFCFAGGGTEHCKIRDQAKGCSNIVCLPYQRLEHLSDSLSSADLHIVVMGDAYVGIVHPSKIYNVLSLGVPVLYIGPEESHVTALARGDRSKRWFYPAKQGDVDLVVDHILKARLAGVSPPVPEEQSIAQSFSRAVQGTRLTKEVADLSGRREPVLSDWVPVLWFAALMVACYGVVIARLVRQWLTDDDMSHGMFVPILAGYIVWQRRARLFALPASSSRWGLLLMLAGALMLCIGPPSLPTFVFMTRVALLFSVAGLLLYVRGAATVRELAYPLLLLVFMIPLPGFVYQKITLPLQFMASSASEHILEFLGYSVFREGNILHLPGQTLSVVEACSGLRSLLSLSFLAQSYVYLFDRRVWMRAVVAMAVIPIAVMANSLRIVASAVAGRIDEDWGHGVFHASTGWVVFVVAFSCLVMAHYLISTGLARYHERAHVL